MQSKQAIEVVVVRTGQAPKVEQIENVLKSKQQVVGGWIEYVSLHFLGDGWDEIVLVCNEEGKVMGLPTNFSLVADGEVVDLIVGNCFFVGASGTGHDRSLTEQERDLVMGYLKEIGRA